MAAFIGEYDTSDKELLGGKRKVDFVFRSPEVLVEEERFRKMFPICFLINRTAVVCFLSVSLNNKK